MAAFADSVREFDDLYRELAKRALARDYLTVAEAAALMESLAINHPFVDGNKRIAFAAANVFLRINGWRLDRPPTQIHAEMLAMFESGMFDIAHLAPWLSGFAREQR